MILSNILSSLRVELHDMSVDLYTDDELTRAVEKSISLMSRLLPKRDIITATVTSDMIVNDYILDISSILSDYIRVDRVEYPADDSPPTLVTFEEVNGKLLFRTDVNLTADDEIRIQYITRWTAPTLQTKADYPSHLNDPVIIGSAGQAMIFKAEKYVQLAAEVLAEDRETLAEIQEMLFTEAPTITTELDLAKTALDAAKTCIANGCAELSGADGSLGSTTTALGNLSTAAGDSEGFLTTGAPLINAATRGDKVGETYGQYAQVQSNIALVYEREIAQRVAIAMAYESIAGRAGTLGNAYVNEATQRLALVARILDRYRSELDGDRNKVTYYSQLVAKSTQYETASKQYLDIAGRYLASGQAKINEFLTSLGIKPEFTTQRASAEQR